MFNNKYAKVLTVILVIAIIILLSLIGYWLYNNLKEDKLEKDAETGIEEFNKDHGILPEETPEAPETPDDTDDEEEELPEIVETDNPSINPGNSGSSGSNSDGKTKYKGFTMVGYIEIPKTGVKIPILEKVTKKSLEVAVAILYPLDAKLNESDNVVIAGHNYRNKLFFSNNKKLAEGDKIYITDESGRRMTYVVYKNFEASPEDTSFYTRDTGGVPEITLTTCTQDSSKRTIILARAQ